MDNDGDDSRTILLGVYRSDNELIRRIIMTMRRKKLMQQRGHLRRGERRERGVKENRGERGKTFWKKL